MLVFLTGATGFLGTQIVRQLIKNTGCKIAVLVRADNGEDAIQRLHRAWWDWHESITTTKGGGLF